jgi:tRNA-specific 2-thiouridylase
MAETDNSKRTVVVAMSGGVDSSVAAGLLQREGLAITGATIDFGLHPDRSADAVDSARSVCHRLGIPHVVICAADVFTRDILRPAWDEIAVGRTPSPCVRCNPLVKFRLILELADRLDAAFIATGHYALVEHGNPPVLRRGLHSPKDQTYFLCALDAHQLNRTLFPLGGLTKNEVRRLAEEMNLPVAQKQDSQDACFSDDSGESAETLRRRFDAPARPGAVRATDGTILGRHGGIHRFTVGQRKGLGIALGQRAWVTRIDGQTGTVTLSADEQDLFHRALRATGVHWTGGALPELPLRCQARIRYRSPAADAAVTVDGDSLMVTFDEPQRAITPGQAVVFYDGDRVLGGAWIDTALHSGQQ